MQQKFDICLMNPPYGTRGGKIHFNFVRKCFELCKKQIVIMPFRMMFSSNERYNEQKEWFDPYVVSIEETSSKQAFGDTDQDNVGIYVFDTKRKEKNVSVTYIDNGNIETIEKPSLFDINLAFSDKDKEILKYLDNKEKIDDIRKYFTLRNTKLKNAGDYDYITGEIFKYTDKHIFKAYLTCNLANGSIDAKFFNNDDIGKIFTTPKSLAEDWVKRVGKGFCTLGFDSKEEAENCRAAMKRPLLRFGLYSVQDDQNLNLRCYRYIPLIDWTDPKCRTDEGILELCGCPKDKITEYVDYATDIIGKVDRKEISKKRK